MIIFRIRRTRFDVRRIVNLIDLPTSLRSVAINKVGCPHQLPRRRNDIRIIISATAFRKVRAFDVDLHLMEFIFSIVGLTHIWKIIR